MHGQIEKRYLSPAEAAEYIGTTIGTLRFWRCRGGGPKWVGKKGGLIRYLRNDLDVFVTRGVVDRPAEPRTSKPKAAPRSVDETGKRRRGRPAAEPIPEPAVTRPTDRP
ncbi:MAG TPA: helix-turn-helix domain-containing protein, partial [Telmatospirillum sp.]|nr:helix-turn-helix domain-containing protein [Telmatospirillum sp.]